MKIETLKRVIKFIKANKLVTKAVNNKRVQNFVKARVSKTQLAIIVAVLSAFGMLGASNVTTEEVTALIKENGGSAVMSVMQEEVVDTGLIEEEVEEADAGVNPYEPSMKLPSWKEVKGNGIYERERDQEHGTCVFESYDIMTIEALKLMGLDPVTNGVDPFLDINHSYFSKLYQPRIDSGTVPSQAYKRFKDEGLPIRTTYQDQDSENKKFADVLAEENPNAYNYKIKAPFVQIASGRGADDFFRAYEAELKKGNKPLFRISKRNHRNVAWFHETTPYIKSQVRNPSGGGHSMAGGSQFGIFEYKGEPTVYIYESAGSVRYHLARLSVLDMVMTGWELYNVAGSTSVVSPFQPIIEPAPTSDILLTTRIVFGQRGEAVVALQKYLIGQGIIIPAGATGFFGNQTKTALDQWQDLHFGNIYNGTVWGTNSQNKYRLIATQ